MKSRVMILLALAGVRMVLGQTAPWPVKDAIVCVEALVKEVPDHPDLGVYLKIPPGNALPGRFAISEVRDGKGASLPHLQIGCHPADGLGILFAKPESGDTVSIYLQPSPNAPPRPQGVKLIPSVFLFTRNGNASLNAARRLNSGYPLGRDSFSSPWRCIGSMVNPFGPDDDYSSWYVGCIVLEKPERIYFATVSDEGSEFYIDDKLIHSWPGLHTRKGGEKGQHGAYVELSAGLHRIDYYHFEARGPQEAQLVWKRKGVTEGDLPELVTGFAHSGEASIKAIRFRDGRTAAAINGFNKPSGYIWLGDQPLTLFTLDARGLDTAQAGTATIAWEFGKGTTLKVAEPSWLVSGNHDLTTLPVSLAVSNAAGIARTTARLVSPWTPTARSLEDPSDRLAFRKAFYHMAMAVPPNADPCAEWKKDHWGLLVELMEPYRGGPIMQELFSRGFDTLQKIAPEHRWVMEERFLESLRLRNDDQRMLDWIQRFERGERDNARKFRWRDERVCVHLYYMGEVDAARREATLLKETAMTPDQNQVAAIRMGDVERSSGNPEAAVVCYQEALERFRNSRKTGMPGGRLAYVTARGKSTVPGGGKRRHTGTTTLKRIDEWKERTVRDASMYATITSYIEQGALDEAFQKLSEWEFESPVSKLGGEYAMAEAALYLSVGDTRRALYPLATYRKSVEMGAQLADVMKKEIECQRSLNNKAAVREIAAEFLRRFPGHPFEEGMKEALDQ